MRGAGRYSAGRPGRPFLPFGFNVPPSGQGAHDPPTSEAANPSKISLNSLGGGPFELGFGRK